MKNYGEKIKKMFIGNEAKGCDIFNPSRDWKIFLAVFFVILVTFLYFDYSIYKNIDGENMFVGGTEPIPGIEKLKTSDLDKIENYFNGKKTAEKTLVKSQLIDPAI